MSPRSACPSCGVAIAAWDKAPVLSWLLLSGRCRSCASPISLRYPIIELASAGLFAGTAARFGFNWALPAFLVLFAGLLALATIDLEHLVLPKRVVYVLLGLLSVMMLLAAAITHQWHDLLIASTSALAWFVIFFALNAVDSRLLGFGDVRLAPVIGLALGWLGVRFELLGFFAANMIGAIVGLALIATKRISRQSPIPYGVFLAVGTALAVFAGRELLQPFQGLR